MGTNPYRYQAFQGARPGTAAVHSGRRATAESGARVLRGGSWNNNDTDNFRCANRNNNDPTKRNDNNGFRCASTLAAGARRSTDSRGVRARVQAGSWSRGKARGAEYENRAGRLVALQGEGFPAPGAAELRQSPGIGGA
jgi:hypothetical protein